MEKLLDLLNEYEDPMVSWYEKYDEETGFFILNNWQKAYEEVIVGKTYWFIEWLVQNLKINVDELRKHWYITKTYDLDEPWEWYSYLDWVLMLLSIQDNPIKFLISILR